MPEPDDESIFSPHSRLVSHVARRTTFGSDLAGLRHDRVTRSIDTSIAVAENSQAIP
jgi:hypothetical protein